MQFTFVSVFPVLNFQHSDDFLLVINSVDDSESSLSDSVVGFSFDGKFFRTFHAGIFGKGVDFMRYLLSPLLLTG